MFNMPEQLFRELALNSGWRPLKRGWPDFLCFNDKTGEIIAVEVKPRINGPGSRMKMLKREQSACMDFLSSKGIRCFVSDGLTLEVYSQEKHANPKQRLRNHIARLSRLSGVGGDLDVASES